jgi:hypothetical protein
LPSERRIRIKIKIRSRRLRNRVFSELAPGMASAKPPASQKTAADDSVEADGLARIFRATGRESAAARRPQSSQQHW